MSPGEERRTTAKKLDPSPSARAMYGSELRHHRERHGLSQAGLADVLFVVPSFVANLETGRRRISPELAARVDRLLSADGFFIRNLAASRAAPSPAHIADTSELETEALTIREWDALVVPGLLQTNAYAHALTQAHGPLLADEAARQRWATRRTRNPTLRRARTPGYWAVLSETVLRRTVGDPTVMAEQLRHLATLIRGGHAVVHILPTSGHATTPDSALRLMTFTDDAPTAYFTAHDTGLQTADLATVHLAAMTWDLFRTAALPAEVSLALIETTAQEYEHHGKTVERGRVSRHETARA